MDDAEEIDKFTWSLYKSVISDEMQQQIDADIINYGTSNVKIEEVDGVVVAKRFEPDEYKHEQRQKNHRLSELLEKIATSAPQTKHPL